MTEQLIVAFVILLAVFIQSVSGFGFALVTMAWLPAVIGIQQATPLVALVMSTVEIFLLIHYRQAFNMEAVWRIVIASLVGIPFGILVLGRFDESILMAVLGVTIMAYALYALSETFLGRIRLPELRHPSWAYLFGLIAGMLGGAYNTSGPLVIIYGNCRHWDTFEFKSNLQGFFVITSFVIAFGHAWNGNITPEIWQYYLWSIPTMVFGVIAGTRLDKFLNPEIFRKLVLILLVIMGFRLAWV
jgi:uncharacterized membrane protein YfcA